MAKVLVPLTMSLDGFIAGPNDGVEQPLGDGGMRLFDWYFDGTTPIRQYQAGARTTSRTPGAEMGLCLGSRSSC
jgi:hypothetical protein